MQEVVDQYIQMLGTGIVNIINMFRPQLVLIGGEMSSYADSFLPDLRRMIQEDSFGGVHGMIPLIEKVKLGEYAGVIGAANL